MLRRLITNALEIAQQQPETVAFPHPFTKPDTVPFGWLTSVSPCFPVKAGDINILTEPSQFYSLIKEGCLKASRRIVLVSLYLGGGTLERDLVQSLLKNSKLAQLDIDVLLDYTRGSRTQDNSRTALRPLLRANTNKNCRVSLYHTPDLRGLRKKITPDRWNELYGLQHMKLYIFDDTLVISGANLSNDYFTNRQDRYFVIHNRNLSDFYCGLVRRVSKFSLKLDRDDNEDTDWGQLPYEGDREAFVQKAGDSIERYLYEAKCERNIHKEEGHDTWIFPLVQMGQMGVDQDARATARILAEAPPNSDLYMATGYFNLTKQYMDTLVRRSKANCKILMAHPEANGFLGAKGPAGGIPYAYSLIAYKFQNKVKRCRQDGRIALFEYLRERWTYHAKGLWYYPPKSKTPCLTLIGSPNFGERSVKRDLETQLAIVTENKELRQSLHDECQRLYRLGLPAETQRDVPLWVHAFVLFFRNYF